jgi:hypothetical protein
MCYRVIIKTLWQLATSTTKAADSRKERMRVNEAMLSIKERIGFKLQVEEAAKRL